MVLVGSSVAISRTLVAAPLLTAQAIRYGVASVVLLILARACGARITRPRGREWLWLASISATGLVLFNIAIVRGVAQTGPAMIAVAVACVPVLLSVLGPLLQRQAPRRQVVLAAVVVTAGAVLVEGAGRVSAAGLAWAGVALACEASFTLLAIPVLGRHGAWGVSVHSVWIGAVMLTVLGLVTEGPAAAARLTPSDFAAVAYLAVLVTVVAFVLWYSTVAALGPARAGVLTGIAPVSAALTGMATGSRGPSPAMWAGIAVVMAGLAAGLWSRARPGLPSPAASPAAGPAPESRVVEPAPESRVVEPARPSRIAEPALPNRAAELAREGGAA
jgi:drug/metabolite transporter (DMT)-like permease